MTFREFLALTETSSLNPIGGPTSNGSSGMDFWSGKNANMSVGNSFQSTGPEMPKGTFNSKKPNVIPPGPFSMVVGQGGPDMNKGGKKAAFASTQETPIERPGSNMSPRGMKAKWSTPAHSPFALGKQQTTVSPGLSK